MALLPGGATKQWLGLVLDVCYWHIADVPLGLTNVCRNDERRSIGYNFLIRRSGCVSAYRDEQMRTKHLAASWVTGFLLVLMAALTAQAGIWCPTPIPGALMKYCLCRSLTGRAEVSSPSPLPPLKLIGLWRDLNAASMTDWIDQVQAREGKRRFLSHRWALACDRDRDCTVTRTTAGGAATYRYSCYAKARPGPCGQRFC